MLGELGTLCDAEQHWKNHCNWDDWLRLVLSHSFTHVLLLMLDFLATRIIVYVFLASCQCPCPVMLWLYYCDSMLNPHSNRNVESNPTSSLVWCLNTLHKAPSKSIFMIKWETLMVQMGFDGWKCKFDWVVVRWVGWKIFNVAAWTLASVKDHEDFQ
jgi:hypothetical protein